MSDEVFEELRNFVSEFSGYDPAEINRDTRLLVDLSIYGDDAADLLMAFSKKFHVDVSQFRIDEYFGSEGWDFIGEVFSIFKKYKPLKVLTMANLEKAIYASKLDEEVINS
jgi:acyl carrier protein